MIKAFYVSFRCSKHILNIYWHALNFVFVQIRFVFVLYDFLKLRFISVLSLFLLLYGHIHSNAGLRRSASTQMKLHRKSAIFPSFLEKQFNLPTSKNDFFSLSFGFKVQFFLSMERKMLLFFLPSTTTE